MTSVNLLIVGAGSCLGGMARYLVSRAAQGLFHGSFPWGTLTVNVAGCFIMGLVCGFLERGGHLSDGLKLFITVGFCGGFTTFSTFMRENWQLFTETAYMAAALYAAVSCVAGFLAMCLACWLGRLPG